MVETEGTSSGDASWIVGGGEMGNLIREFDWSRTPIGPMKDWSPTLRTMIPFMLANSFPFCCGGDQSGFGMTLIERTVKGQRGSADRSIEADGIHWVLTLPLSHADMKAPAGISKASSRMARTASTPSPSNLEAKTFVVIEDEPLIALNILAALEQARARVAGQAATVSEALRLVEDRRFEGALLDANLRGQPIDDVAAALARREVPFAFVTGYGREALPAGFAQAKALKKPFTEEQLLQAAAELLA